ncbi:MAG: NADH:flavin oxidoreductase, partial [Acidimicrobiales bacterium]|nr:NADH:flavin oxidoreductase [Acidimicrobiales bacterium]
MTDRSPIVQMRKLADADAFRAHLDGVGLDLCFDAELVNGTDAPLARPFDVGLADGVTRTVGNRFAVLPMEGWDATS